MACFFPLSTPKWTVQLETSQYAVTPRSVDGAGAATHNGSRLRPCAKPNLVRSGCGFCPRGLHELPAIASSNQGAPPGWPRAGTQTIEELPLFPVPRQQKAGCVQLTQALDDGLVHGTGRSTHPAGEDQVQPNVPRLREQAQQSRQRIAARRHGEVVVVD